PKIMLVAIMLSAAGSVSAQTGSVKGIVWEQETNEGVVGANILLKGTAMGTISAADGTFELGGLPTGNHVIAISFIGYASREIPRSGPGASRKSGHRSRRNQRDRFCGHRQEDARCCFDDKGSGN